MVIKSVREDSMLSTSHVKRKKYKLKFLEKHRNFSENAFRDAVRLRGKGESLKNSENISKLVYMARKSLGYSDKTNSDDIFWGLMKLHHETMEGKS